VDVRNLLATEPARTLVWPVAVLVGLATFLGAVATVEVVTWQAVAGAAGLALTQVLALFVTGHAVREKVWPAASVGKIEAGYEQEIADVEAKVDAIASAEAALTSYHRDLDG
jgi:hypothetical protein